MADGKNIGFVGSRDYPVSQYWRIHETLKAFSPQNDTAISGGAKGVDTIAIEYAEQVGMNTQVFYPRSNTVKALFDRNQEIIDASDLVYAFWDGLSSGTLDSITRTIQCKKPLTIIFPDGLKVVPTKSVKWRSGNIYYACGNMLDSNADMIVNPCNTFGAHGRGLSLAITKKWGWVSPDYKKALSNGLLSIGKLHVTMSPDKHEPHVLHFPTKENWRNKSELAYIESGLKYFSEHYEEWDVSSVAFPMLGCGNGGLNWNIVRMYVEEYLSDLPIKTVFYTDVPTKDMVK